MSTRLTKRKTEAILILALLISWTCFTMTSNSVIGYYNAEFVPDDPRFLLLNSSSITTVNACACLCHNNPTCFVMNYYGSSQICTLFFAKSNDGEFRVLPTNRLAATYKFLDREFSRLIIYNFTNETFYAVWNTTAGSNSLASYSGYGIGSYWPSSPPKNLFDGNLSSLFTSHGSCNYTGAPSGSECGKNSGMYVTLKQESFHLVAFRIAAGDFRARDPLWFTIEGSDAAPNTLTNGSQWRLIYNGSSGVETDPGRRQYGPIMVITDSPRSYDSYRLLVVKKNGDSNSISFGELWFIGYF